MVGVGRGLVGEQIVPTEAGIPVAALRVEDPEDRPSPRRAVSIAGDERLRPLPDDVAPEPDPRPPGKFQAETGRLGDGRGQTTGQPGWFEHDEERLRSPGERRQPAESVRDPCRAIRRGEAATGQVQDEQIHRPPGQQRATDGEAFVQRLRRDDHEPLEPDPAGDRLDRVEAAREIEPGHDRALGLGLRREPQDERGPAAGAVAADRDTGRTRQTAGPKDRVERREPGADYTVVEGRGRGGDMERGEIGRAHV